MMSRFRITTFDYDYDGAVFSVKKTQQISQDLRTLSEPEYYCEEISEISSSLFGLLLSWITYKQLGLNNNSLVVGISRALRIIE